LLQLGHQLSELRLERTQLGGFLIRREGGILRDFRNLLRDIGILLAHSVNLANGDYTPVPLGGAPARFQSMLKGDTYGAILSSDLYHQAETAGMHSLGDQHQVLPEYPGGVIAVCHDWAEANHEVLVSFLKAWREAGESMQTDSDSAARLVANELGQPVEAARAQLPTSFNRGELNLLGLQSVLDLRNQFGYALPMGPDLATYVDTSFWQATLGGCDPDVVPGSLRQL
jgi:ABC-type nitrate/sulfonate/bicarbonate transport system substrate-binding protein